jgi:hypothetical protein
MADRQKQRSFLNYPLSAIRYPLAFTPSSAA